MAAAWIAKKGLLQDMMFGQGQRLRMWFRTRRVGGKLDRAGSRIHQLQLQMEHDGRLPEDVPDGLVVWLRRRLLKWHKGRAREFAWRRQRTPWLVLMAEVLLQRTDSKQVEPVYVVAARRYATPRAFLRASVKSLRRLFVSL